MLDRNYDEYWLDCDMCQTEYIFDSFDEAIDYMKNNGWKMKKENNVWVHICPDCLQQLTKKKGDDRMKKVTIYTDGACKGNGQENALGGYAIILQYQEKEKLYEKEITKVVENTTNNEMELTAVVEALKALKEPCEVDLYSDSAYVVNAINNKWLEKWQANGWKTSNKEDVKNKELWLELIELFKTHKVNFIKVKGHADNELNNKCDKLVNQAIKEYLK